MKTLFLALSLLSLSCAHGNVTTTPRSPSPVAIGASGLCIEVPRVPDTRWKVLDRHQFASSDVFVAELWLTHSSWVDPAILVVVSRPKAGEDIAHHAAKTGTDMTSKLTRDDGDGSTWSILSSEKDASGGYTAAMTMRNPQHVDAYRGHLRSVRVEQNGETYGVHVLGIWNTPWDEALQGQVNIIAATAAPCRP